MFSNRLLGLPQLLLLRRIPLEPPRIPGEHHNLIHPDPFIDHYPAEDAAIAISVVPGHGDLFAGDECS